MICTAHQIHKEGDWILYETGLDGVDWSYESNRDMCSAVVDWTVLAQDRDMCWAVVDWTDMAQDFKTGTCVGLL